MKNHITVRTATTPATVRAIVRGEWAAHPALATPEIWTLTHIPSGGYIAMAFDRRTMAQRLRALAALPPCPVQDWTVSERGVTTASKPDVYLDWLAQARAVA